MKLHIPENSNHQFPLPSVDVIHPKLKENKKYNFNRRIKDVPLLIMSLID